MKALGLALVIALVAAAPARAGYKIMYAGEARAVGKLGLSVTPPNDWNRLGDKIGRNAESWTLDGLTLNDLSFYAGIADDKTLFRETDRKYHPLPHFQASMLPPDIVSLFEGSYRVAAGTSLFSVGGVEPATFAGHPGVHFTYAFTLQDEEVKRSGEGTGAVIGGKLYLITFEAPSIYYYERDAGAYRLLVASARIN
ncbi:MAG: hypothetical protein H0X36_01610 [Sphingomonadaceae bacterium]|nr:hypothetical protein [Sphingomonadaceae bacterium]